MTFLPSGECPYAGNALVYPADHGMTVEVDPTAEAVVLRGKLLGPFDGLRLGGHDDGLIGPVIDILFEVFHCGGCAVALTGDDMIRLDAERAFDLALALLHAESALYTHIAHNRWDTEVRESDNVVVNDRWVGMVSLNAVYAAGAAPLDALRTLADLTAAGVLHGECVEGDWFVDIVPVLAVERAAAAQVVSR